MTLKPTYSWFATDIIAAMLDDTGNKRFLIYLLASFVLSSNMAVTPLSIEPLGAGCKPAIELIIVLQIGHFYLINLTKISTSKKKYHLVLFKLLASKAQLEICDLQNLVKLGSTYQFSCLRHDSHACESKTLISRPHAKSRLQTNFSHLTHRCEL